jgi:hypothetical protein
MYQSGNLPDIVLAFLRAAARGIRYSDETRLDCRVN